MNHPARISRMPRTARFGVAAALATVLGLAGCAAPGTDATGTPTDAATASTDIGTEPIELKIGRAHV